MPSIEKFDPTYIEEMRGIAEGANEPFAAVVLMNARTEMVAAARQEQEAKQVPDGCTAAFALPEASADGVLLHGQNWDWRAECAETGVLLRIHRDDGPDILTFTEAGGLARSGLNSAGIGLTGYALQCDRDYKRGPGIPLPFIRRKVLESAYLANAVHTIMSTPRLGSNHMAVIMRRRGLRLRMCARRHVLAGARSRRLRARQPLDRRCGARPDEGHRPRRDAVLDLSRQARARPAFPQARQAHAGRFPLGLLRRWNSPWSVCRPPRLNTRGVKTATTAMILMRPGEGHLEACPMPSLNKRFTTYSLTPDRTAQRQAAD